MMIEITFREFYELKYQEDGFHELYVVKKDLCEILYVGISSQKIWDRWFGWNGHIFDGGDFLDGRSSVGEKIVDHLPDSWEWKIQLWTLEDCTVFCEEELNPNGRYNIKYLEPFMIQKLHPNLNATFNLNPGIDRMPKSEKEKKREAELDKAYYEAFENKSK